MATTPTQARIHTDIKAKTASLFACLGMDMSCAINLFLYQCIQRGGLPFAVELTNYSENTLETTEKTNQIS